MGESEIAAFLSHLATVLNVAASTQNQALSALLFLYQKVLDRKLEFIAGVERVLRPPKLPSCPPAPKRARSWNNCGNHIVLWAIFSTAAASASSNVCVYASRTSTL